MKNSLAIAALALVVAAPMAAEETTRWLNVHVQEAEDGMDVKVHLPMQTVLAVMRAVNVEGFEAGKVHLEVDDAEIDWPQLLAAVKDAPDGEFVTATTEDADVRVHKSAGMLSIDVDEKGGGNARVRVRVPTELIDVLTVDETNTLDVVAMIERLESVPGGDIVQVDADGATVRVWIE